MMTRIAIMTGGLRLNITFSGLVSVQHRYLRPFTSSALLAPFFFFFFGHGCCQLCCWLAARWSSVHSSLVCVFAVAVANIAGSLAHLDLT